MAFDIKNRILRKIIFSYALMFYIPFLIIGAFAYGRIIQEKRDSLLQEKTVLTENALISMETHMSEIYATAVSISNDPQLGEYCMRFDANKREAPQLIRRYLAANTFIDSCFVYYPSYGMIFSREGMSREEVFNTSIVNLGSGKTLTQLCLEVTEPYITGYSECSYMEESNAGITVIIYPMFVKKEYIIFVIRNEQISTIYESALGNCPGMGILLDDSGKTVNVMLDSKLQDSSAISLSDGKTVRVDGRKYRKIQRSVNAIPNMSLVVLLDNSVLFSSSTKEAVWIFFFLFVMNIIGMVFVMYLVYKNYGPIKGMADALGMDVHRSDVELDSINKQVGKFVAEKKLLEYKLSFSESVALEMAFMKLLLGEKLSNMDEKLLEPYKIYQNYIVVIIDVRGYKNENSSFDEVLTEALERNNEECFAKNIYMAVKNKRVIICGYNGGKTEKDFFAESMELIDSASVKASASRVRGKLDEVGNAYVEAETAAEYAIQNSDGHIIYYADIREKEESCVLDGLIKKTAFRQALMTGNKKISTEILRENISAIKREPQSVLIIRFMCSELIGIVVNVAKEQGAVIKNSDMKKIMRYTSLEELENNLIQQIDGICRVILEKRHSDEKKIKSDILEYIENNFCDPNMSIKMVSDSFDISDTYISRCVKQEIGISFSEYIMQQRMEKAKELLVTTDMMVKDIVTEIGYADVANFTRKFRIEEGMSPSQYRKIYSNAESQY